MGSTLSAPDTEPTRVQALTPVEGQEIDELLCDALIANMLQSDELTQLEPEETDPSSLPSSVNWLMSNMQDVSRQRSDDELDIDFELALCMSRLEPLIKRTENILDKYSSTSSSSTKHANSSSSSTRSGSTETHPTYSCPICFSPSESLSSIACGHVFCTECINTALTHSERCPVCRAPANASDVRKLFLVLDSSV